MSGEAGRGAAMSGTGASRQRTVRGAKLDAKNTSSGRPDGRERRGASSCGCVACVDCEVGEAGEGELEEPESEGCCAFREGEEVTRRSMREQRSGWVRGDACHVWLSSDTLQ